MIYKRIVQKIEDSAHHFLLSLKTEAIETKEATIIIQKYIKEGTISNEEEKMLKEQMLDSLKIIGVVVPFVLIPGASVLMPILIKVASKHNVQILPSSFYKEKKKEVKEDSNSDNSIS